MSKEANTYVLAYLPTLAAVYIHDGFGASIGVAHSDLFIAVRVYLVVVVVVVVVVFLAQLALWEHLLVWCVARVFENARTVQMRSVLCALYANP